MKFGVEFSSRSVSKWRNYNIDYDLLKKIIREVTVDFETGTKSPTNSSSSELLSSHANSISTTNSYPQLNTHQKKLLKKLYRTFKEQIDFVSLFANSKVGELSRRSAALKRQCNIFLKNETCHRTTKETAISLKLRSKKVLAFHKELDQITKELQDLSRFILLQKIAIKKLLKKFVKYSTYSQKVQFTEKINNNFLINNPKSFTNINLNDVTLETTLLYDFLDTFISGKSYDEIRNRKSSINTIDSLNLTTSSYTFNRPSENNEDKKMPTFSRSTMFDIVSKKKGPRSYTFWIHPDNLEEVKMLLSSEFKLITDDSLFTEDVELKHTRSSANLSAKVSDLPSNNADISRPYKDANKFRPETNTLSIWLNNPEKPLFIQKAPLDSFNYDLSFSDKLNLFKAEPYSQILLSNTELQNSSLLMVPIGGLRQFSISLVNESIVDVLFHDNQHLPLEDKAKTLKKLWLKSGFEGNGQMSELSFDWVLRNKVQPLSSVESKKLRYINLNKTEKIDCYISLDWDIKIDKADIDGGKDPITENFPYGILEINFDVPEESLPKSITSLINSYLVYRVDNLNFSLNNYLIYHQIYLPNANSASPLITDDEMLIFIAPWHNVLENKDIRLLPEMRTKSRASNVFMNSSLTGPDEGILLNKDDEPANKPGYWNEFDNGSDYDADGDGFYVYEDTANDAGFWNWALNFFYPSNENDLEQYSTSNNRDLHWLSKENTKTILNWVDRFALPNFMSKGTQRTGDELKPLVTKSHLPLQFQRHLEHNRNNSSTKGSGIGNEHHSADDEDSGSENEALMRIPNNNESYGTIGNRNHAVSQNDDHDKVLSFMYMVLIMFSLITSSTGALIVSTVFTFDSTPQFTWGLTTLVIFAIICLVFSIMLTGFSIFLILCRYSYAPAWHIGFVWTGAILAVIFFFYGITICF